MPYIKKDDFESEDRVFDIKGDWIRTSSQYQSGRYSLTNKSINSDSEITLTVDLIADGYVKFDYRSQSASSDVFRFYINGVEKKGRSGYQNWESCEINLPSGVYEFKWDFRVNPYYTDNKGHIYIDNLEIAGMQPPHFDKFLYGDSSTRTIYTVNESDELINIGSGKPTIELFREHGITQIKKEHLNSLQNPRIYRYNESPQLISVNSKYGGVFIGKTVVQNFDFKIPTIKSIELFATIPENCIVKMIISFDNGHSWYTYKEDSWQQCNIDEIKSKGMTKEEIEAVSTEALNELKGDSDNIRVAYYLEQDNTRDEIHLDFMRINYEDGV